MSFFDHWPLNNYFVLYKISKNNKPFYYNVNDDEIITKDEAEKLVNENDYRISNTYYLVGDRQTINTIYKSINNKELPIIPENIKKKINKNNKHDKVYQDFKNTYFKEIKPKSKPRIKKKISKEVIKDSNFSLIPQDLFTEQIIQFMSYQDIINLSLAAKCYSHISSNIITWSYLLIRDFKDNKNYPTLQKARSSYFRQNGFNVDYQIVGKNLVWKPKPGDFVTYSAGSDSYANIVISVYTNDKGRVVSATIKSSKNYVVDSYSRQNNIILKTGINPDWIFAESKGRPAKYQTYMREGVYINYLDPSF